MYLLDVRNPRFCCSLRLNNLTVALALAQLISPIADLVMLNDVERDDEIFSSV